MAPPTSDHTPLRYNIAGNYKYRQSLLTTPQVKVQLASAMHRRWIGPVPPDMLMRDLMPISSEKLKEYTSRRDQVKFRLKPPQENSTLAVSEDSERDTSANKQEKRLYKDFAASIARHNLSPLMPFFISADKKKKNTDKRPDGGLKRRQSEKEIHQVAPTHPYHTRSKTLAAANVAPIKPQVSEPQPFNWCLDTLVVEFKGCTSDDPFYTGDDLRKQLAVPESERDYDVSFEKPFSSARKTRGQLTMYAREMFNHQQRTHLFQLLVTGRHARIIYFDHSGAIVTERIDYIKNPSVLGEFFWRINHMTDKARGMDPTAVRAEDEEKEAFRSSVSELVANMKNPLHPQRRIPDAELTLDDEYPVYKMLVHDGVSKTDGNAAVDGQAGSGKDKVGTEVKTMELLVQRPIFDAVSPLGRGTRGYIAIHRATKGGEENGDRENSSHSEDVPLFLKDTWRVHHALLQAESEVYRLLEKYGVTRIPRLICGGDVREADGQVQRTICTEWIEKLEELFRDGIQFAHMRVHTHHRLVQRLAYPIESARNSQEMVKAFDDVLAVIEEAYENVPTKLLHRDVSAGNVMLGDELEEDEKVGLLGDWDHATEMEPEGEYEHQLFRTGTWPFMSIALLRDLDKAHELLDDLEAIFWTLLYAALHQFKHTGTFDMDIFNWWKNEHRWDNTPSGRVTGGALKNDALPRIGQTFEFVCSPLQNLIKDLSRAWRDYYRAVDDLSGLEGDLAKNVREAETESDIDEYLRSSVEAAREDFKALHAKLSKPSYWRAYFARARRAKGWINDLSTEVLYPGRTEDKGIQLREMNSRSSLHTELEPAGNAARQLPDTVEEEEEEEMETAGYSSCDDGEDEDALDDNDLDNIFVPIPQADQRAGLPNPNAPSPPVSPSLLARIRIPRSSGSMIPSSSKRTHEGPDGSEGGSRLSKRYRSAPGPESMPPPVLPMVRTRPTATRATRSQQPSSGEASTGAAGPSQRRTGLRSQSKTKGQSKFNTTSM